MKKLLIACCIVISLWSCSEDSVSPVETEGQPSAVARATEQRVDFKSTDAFVRKDGVIIPLSRNHIDRVYSLPEGSYELVVSKKGFAGYQTRVTKEELVSLAEGRSQLTMKETPASTIWFWPGAGADSVSFIFDAKNKTSITLTWGDGSETTQSGKRDLHFSHSYSGDIYPDYQYEGYVTTNMNAITSVEIEGVSDFLFMSFLNLKRVVVRTDYMFSPNIYQNAKLEYVDLTNLRVVTLDLPPDNHITTLKLAGMTFDWAPDDNMDYIVNTTYNNAVSKNLSNGFIDLRNMTGISYNYENGNGDPVYFEMKLSDEAMAKLHTLEQEYGWTVLY